jgi:AraC-like DNA-binding protein
MGMVEPIQNIPQSSITCTKSRKHLLRLGGDFVESLRETGILSSGVCQLGPGHEVKMPDKDFHLVLFTVEGGAWYKVPGSEGILTPGDLWIVPRPVPLHYGTDERWRLFWCHLADTERWAFLRPQSAHVLPTRASQFPQSAMEEYVADCVSGRSEMEKARRAYADIIGTIREDGGPQAVADPLGQGIREALSALWEDVSANPDQPWRLKAMAARLHLSHVHFYRQVVRYEGIGPREMVARLRIQRAAEMLKTTNYTLDRIASLVGYETAFALSRSFKKLTGYSPREYRSSQPQDS